MTPKDAIRQLQVLREAAKVNEEKYQVEVYDYAINAIADAYYMSRHYVPLQDVLGIINEVRYNSPEKPETLAWNKACKFIRKNIMELLPNDPDTSEE